MFTLCFKKWFFYCAHKFARCHPNLITLAGTCQKNFVMTWLACCKCMLPCKGSNNFESVPNAVLAKLNSKISQKEKFAADSKCSKCYTSVLTQAHSHPCHWLMAMSTTRCPRPDHAAIRSHSSAASFATEQHLSIL